MHGNRVPWLQDKCSRLTPLRRPKHLPPLAANLIFHRSLISFLQTKPQPYGCFLPHPPSSVSRRTMARQAPFEPPFPAGPGKAPDHPPSRAPVMTKQVMTFLARPGRFQVLLLHCLPCTCLGVASSEAWVAVPKLGSAECRPSQI